MQRILVATDGSAGADRAVDVAAQMAKVFGGTLRLLTIVELPDSAAFEELKEIEHVSEGEIADIAARATLVRAGDQARRLGTNQIQMQAEIGDPSEIILSIALRRNADAVVLGKRGRGRLAGLLLGSVSQKIASLAPCSVVVVP